MWGAPEEPITRRFRARLRTDRTAQVTLGAFAVALVAALGFYVHPDRVQVCLEGSATPALDSCVASPFSLDLLVGLAVAGFAVALVATVFGLVADWRSYRATR